MTYRAPGREIRFILDHVIEFAAVTALPRFADVTPDLTDAILTGAARLCDDVLAPLQRAGDQHPARLQDGAVVTSPGFAAGYAAIAAGGWVALAAPQAHGGMGLPQVLNTAVNDMMAGACMALQLKPLLAQGQIEALAHHAGPATQALYLPRLISGEWSGTMNLTEPQAGTDVGALTARAVPQADGSHAVTGQKIFISWGDSDLTENVCHLVLARLPDAPAGTRGISLFLVPKYLPDAAGRAGARNAVRVVSLEHKTGLHGSPTCVMEFSGATGWIVGAPHKGMAAMFTMMNSARLAVGVQGIGVAEAALQLARGHAQARVQAGPLTDHADVRRMLATMQAQVFAARCIALACAAAIDRAGADPAGSIWAARAAFLTPIAKAFGSDTGCLVADTGIQVHGGSGYVEDSGAAQFWRDVRVTAIYEGTNGIQAMDLVGRKLADGGDAAWRLLDDVQAGAVAARAIDAALANAVWHAAESLREATESLLRVDERARAAGGVAYLRAFALVLGGHFHLRAALAEGQDGPRLALARVYVRRILPETLFRLAEAAAGDDDLFPERHPADAARDAVPQGRANRSAGRDRDG